MASRRRDTPAFVILSSTLNSLTHPQDSVRLNAVNILSRMPSLAYRTVPALTNTLLTDVSFIVHFTAASALGQLKSTPDMTLPALIGAMDDRNEMVRLESANALRAFGAEAKSTSTVLLKAAKEDPHEGVRQNARAAIHIIDPQTARDSGF